MISAFKKGAKSDSDNYRPISLCCVPCEALEKIIVKRLMKFCADNRILQECQYGFRSVRSGVLQLLSCANS